MARPATLHDQGAAGRRCHVSLLFSDLSDYTALNEASDPELVASLLEKTKALAARVIEKHGGTLNQFYGDGFLAVFGLPTPSEDDVRHAAEAALELHAAIRSLELDADLPPGFVARLHSGVHAGLIYAREADSATGRYELVGDPVNTAARLCAAADSDEILASETALRGVEPFFETEAVAPLVLKGKGKPVPVYRVLGRTAVTTRFEARARRGLTPFIGRARELAELLGAVERARTKKTVVVHVLGDAGVGKTRLIEELRRRVESDVAVYAGCCESYGNIAPLQPFLQVLRQVFGVGIELSREESGRAVDVGLERLGGGLAKHLPTLLQVLSLASQTRVEPPAEDMPLSGAVSALFSKLSERGPLVLLLDDWQWADDASRLLLTQVIEQLARESRPVVAVMNMRARGVPDLLLPDATVLELGPFDLAESEQAIRALVPGTLDLAFTGVIQRRSGGNPLFLEELCQSLPHEGPLDGPGNSVPSTIHGLIQARVERLPSNLTVVSQAAAVIGSEFEEWLLARIVDPTELGRALEDLAKNDVVYASHSPGLHRFKHGITREVVYNSVKLSERRRLHGAIARALEENFGESGALERSEALAAHWSGAADPERASMYAELAGDKASSASSLDCARQQYGAAMLELDRITASPLSRRRWLTISWKWAAACVFSPAPDQVALLERSLEFAEKLGDLESMARSHYWLGWLHYALGQQDRARAHSERAVELAEKATNQKLVAQLVANLGQIQAAGGDCARALEALEQAVSLKLQNARTRFLRAVPVGYAYALGMKALVHGYLGDFAQADVCMDSALRSVRGAEHAIEASLLGLRGMIEIWRGSYAECIETARQSRARAERVSGPYVFATSQTLASYARLALGPDPAALEELSRAVAWVDDRTMRLFFSFSAACLADALLRAGDLAGARQKAERALEQAREGDRLGEVMAYRVLGLAALKSGDTEEASRSFDRADQVAEKHGSRRERVLNDLARAELLRSESDPDGARTLVERSVAALREFGMTHAAESAARQLKA
jgi:class 3 adenylate cyclase/tetratricopeptide (TPR) repeat protein